MAEFATRGVGNAALTTGIIGSAGWLLNGGLGNILGGVLGGNPAATAAAMLAPDNTPVNRYEAAQAARIAELDGEVKLRDSSIYNDSKILELYKYVDSKLEGVNAAINQQAVYNATNTAQLTCMAGQIAQLMSLTKLVVPDSAICACRGNVTITPTTGTTTGT